MGKGDRKTLKGKIYRGSHGNVRPQSPTSKAAVKKTATKTVTKSAAKPAAHPAAKKAAVKKTAPKKPA